MSQRGTRRLRIIVLAQEELLPPETLAGVDDKKSQPWRTEYDVVSTLRGMGHEVQPVGVRSELGVIRQAIHDHKPHVAFNLLEEFDGYPLFDQHVVSYLELMKQKYTGCNPRGLTLSRDKALTKKVMAYHRIHVPRFAVYPLGRNGQRPNRLRFPLFVKSLSDEGSIGIAQASVVRDDEKLKERVDFIHRQNQTPAIAEEYVEGREIYVGVIGNQRLQAYTPWELVMTNLSAGALNIATGKAKWDVNYQKKIGLITQPAELGPQKKKEFERLSKRIYRILGLSGYARMDYRMTEDGLMYLLEVNPNPQIAQNEDFADSAEHCGLKYESLLKKIITLGMNYHPIK
ncbi:MAG: D-alanine--D-alanine ligase [Acidobacteria bacterium]|nr:D-alanine--D-alanine ligase [Acidobacteriota bacterium]MCI0723197.1 D-alanine--D-alanine ligase [Acidobacteriota bacterium]